MKSTTKIIMDNLIRPFLGDLKTSKHGRLATFGKDYKIPRYTLIRIISNLTYEPKMQTILNILRGIERESKNKLLSENLESANLIINKFLGKEGSMEGEFAKLMFAFADVISHRSELNQDYLTAMLSSLTILTLELKGIYDNKDNGPQKLRRVL